MITIQDGRPNQYQIWLQQKFHRSHRLYWLNWLRFVGHFWIVQVLRRLSEIEFAAGFP